MLSESRSFFWITGSVIPSSMHFFQFGLMKMYILLRWECFFFTPLAALILLNGFISMLCIAYLPCLTPTAGHLPAGAFCPHLSGCHHPTDSPGSSLWPSDCGATSHHPTPPKACISTTALGKPGHTDLSCSAPAVIPGHSLLRNTDFSCVCQRLVGQTQPHASFFTHSV